MGIKTKSINLNDENIIIRRMSGKGRAEYMDFLSTETDRKKQEQSIMSYALIVKLSVINEDGTYKYTDANLDEIIEQDAEDLDLLVNEIFDFNGLSEKASEKSKKK